MPRIQEIAKYIGKKITIKGWVYNYRSSGKISFLMVRDGSGIMQAVLTQDEVKPAVWEAQSKMTTESSVEVTGEVVEEKRSPGGFEMHITDLTVVQIAEEYPIGKKEHGPDFLLEQRHLWIRAPRQTAILRIRASIEFAIHEYLRSQGFVEFDAPILTANPAENTSQLFEMKYFDEGKAYLSQSGQLYGEAGAMALGKIYTFGPTFRAEKSKTRRHLTEFWMVEPEAAFMTFEEDLELQEGLIKYLINYVLKNHKSDLEYLERDLAPLEKFAKTKFARVTYKEAIAIWQKLGYKIKEGEDYGADEETALGNHFGLPVFITHFPAKLKAFYMQPDPKNPDLVLAADLIAPEGYGEIIGGSERIGDVDLLKKKIKEFGMKVADFEWYMDLRKFGGVPHAGFGIGIERTVAWLTGSPHVREMIPFPRMINRLKP